MLHSLNSTVKHCRVNSANLMEILHISEIYQTERDALVQLLSSCLGPIDILVSLKKDLINFRLTYAMSVIPKPSSFIGIADNGHVVHVHLENITSVWSFSNLNAFSHLSLFEFHLIGAETLPECFKSNLSCTYLDIRGDRLVNLPYTLTNFRNLTHIFIDSPLPIIPTFFYRWDKIEHISITSKVLTTLPWLLAIRKNYTFNMLSDTRTYYSENMQTIAMNPFSGESHSIFKTALNRLEPELRNMQFNGPLLDCLRELLLQIYPNRYNNIVEKIKANLPLDPLDWTHPDFVSWGAQFEKLGEQYPTATFRDVQEKLAELRIILGDDGFHLTL